MDDVVQCEDGTIANIVKVGWKDDDEEDEDYSDDEEETVSSLLILESFSNILFK